MSADCMHDHIRRPEFDQRLERGRETERLVAGTTRKLGWAVNPYGVASIRGAPLPTMVPDGPLVCAVDMLATKLGAHVFMEVKRKPGEMPKGGYGLNTSLGNREDELLKLIRHHYECGPTMLVIHDTITMEDDLLAAMVPDLIAHRPAVTKRGMFYRLPAHLFVPLAQCLQQVELSQVMGSARHWCPTCCASDDALLAINRFAND